MTVTSQYLLTFTICFVLIGLSNGEIHRAKSPHIKSTGRNTRTTSAESNVAQNFEERSNSNSNIMDGERNMYEVWIYSVCGSIAVGLSGIFPLLIIPIEAGPALKHGAAANKLKLLLSFAVGGLLGDVFLHLLPEAWESLDKNSHDHGGHLSVGLWVLAGILTFLVLEKAFAKEGEFDHLGDECEEEKVAAEKQNKNKNTKHKNLRNRDKHKSNKTTVNGSVQENGKSVLQSKNIKKKTGTAEQQYKQHQNGGHVQLSKDAEEPQNIKISGYLNLFANVIDNFTHGLAVGGSFIVSNKVGFITLLAILLHEIPHEVGDFAILLRSGFDRWKAAKAQLLTATGALVGAMTALLADSAKAAGDSTAWILPFTSGGFIYIALVTVVPDLLQETHAKESVKQLMCLCAGISSMYCVSMIH